MKLLAMSVHVAGATTSYCPDQYAKLFTVPSREQVVSLYCGENVGFASKTYSNKNTHDKQPLHYQSAMAKPYEHEQGDADKATTRPETFIEQPGEPATDLSLSNLHPTSQLTGARKPVSGFESTINDLFNNSLTIKPRQRYIIAKSTISQVQETIANVRDKLGIDDHRELESILVDFMVYAMDNSTSERNPPEVPFVHGGREYTYTEVASWHVPTMRKFYRAIADVMHTWLKANPDVFPHWGNMHGFPKKWRAYAFDTADYCKDIPEEALKAIQSVKDAALTRAPYNLMRPDLKAVGTGSGTIVQQMAGEQFARRLGSSGQGSN